jgi:hypothetical protein
MEDGAPVSVGRTYTKGRRQPYLIRKWPGSNWALPLGPYTITQLVVFVGSVSASSGSFKRSASKLVVCAQLMPMPPSTAQDRSDATASWLGGRAL